MSESATGCTDEHAKFCSDCTTARAYNSIHCQDCGEGRPSAGTTAAGFVGPRVRLSNKCPACGQRFTVERQGRHTLPCGHVVVVGDRAHVRLPDGE